MSWLADTGTGADAEKRDASAREERRARRDLGRGSCCGRGARGCARVRARAAGMAGTRKARARVVTRTVCLRREVSGASGGRKWTRASNARWAGSGGGSGGVRAGARAGEEAAVRARWRRKEVKEEAEEEGSGVGVCECECECERERSRRREEGAGEGGVLWALRGG